MAFYKGTQLIKVDPLTPRQHQAVLNHCLEIMGQKEIPNFYGKPEFAVADPTSSEYINADRVIRLKGGLAQITLPDNATMIVAMSDIE